MNISTNLIALIVLLVIPSVQHRVARNDIAYIISSTWKLKQSTDLRKRIAPNQKSVEIWEFEEQKLLINQESRAKYEFDSTKNQLMLEITIPENLQISPSRNDNRFYYQYRLSKNTKNLSLTPIRPNNIDGKQNPNSETLHFDVVDKSNKIPIFATALGVF